MDDTDRWGHTKALSTLPANQRLAGRLATPPRIARRVLAWSLFPAACLPIQWKTHRLTFSKTITPHQMRQDTQTLAILPRAAGSIEFQRGRATWRKFTIA